MADVQMSVVDGEEMFAHEVTVNFTPLQFTLDFKSITPRTDPRTKSKPSFVLRHKVIMLEPWHAKLVHQILGNVLSKYEEEFGTIKKPKAIEKAEKKQKTTEGTDETPAPTYFG